MASTELRERWTPEAIVLWLPPADRAERWRWRALVCLPALLASPVAWLAGAIAEPGNLGYIWLIGASLVVGVLGTTLALAVRFEPQHVRVEISRAHLGLDDLRLDVRAIHDARWDGDRLAIALADGTRHSRPMAPRDRDRLLDLVRATLPAAAHEDRQVIPLLARPREGGARAALG